MSPPGSTGTVPPAAVTSQPATGGTDACKGVYFICLSKLFTSHSKNKNS
jgi:hypothetical protein